MAEVIPLLKKAGATKVIACISHPILAKNAARNISESDLDELVVSNTVTIPEAKMALLKKKIEVINISSLIAAYLRVQ